MPSRELPVADGGEGTLDVVHDALGGEPGARFGPLALLPGEIAAVESADVIGLGRMTESDVFERSSRASGELINEVLD